jgi:hypothetical protein
MSMMSARSDGNAVGGGVVHRTTLDDRFLVGVDALYGSFSFKGNRTTFANGQSRFETDGRAGTVGASASYEVSRGEHGSVMVGAGVRSIWGSVDGFIERNAQTYHGLTVRDQDVSDIVTSATFGGEYRVTAATKVSGKFTVGHVSGGGDRSVVANFTGDAQQFTVNAPGYEPAFSTLDLRVDMLASEALSLSLTGQVGLFGATSGSHRVGASLNYRF